MKPAPLHLFPLLLVTTLLFPVYGQISQGGFPLSHEQNSLKHMQRVSSLILEPVDPVTLALEDKKNTNPYRYSVFDEIELDIRKSGSRVRIDEGNGTVWYHRIRAENALSVQVYFSRFLLPEGARLFIYDKDYRTIYGAFTEANNNVDNRLMIADLPSDEVIIEYFEPDSSLFEGELVIGKVGKGYRDIHASGSYEDNEGFVHVNCPPGMEWQEQKHAVCKITFVIGRYGYTCSGALVNNVRQDGTPYFLTAHHCISSDYVAKSVVAYFNHEQVGCNGSARSPQSLSGSRLMATGQQSDFTLLKFNHSPSPDYQPYYAGWDARGVPTDTGVSIHHPAGGQKRISLDYSRSESFREEIYWADEVITPPDTHWKVVFDEGRTTSGSSGSPLFNTEKRIIGQLHGGGINDDYYGKLDYSWDNKSGSDFFNLRKYLDPDSTHTLVLDGYYPGGNLPDVQFNPEFFFVCQDAPVRLYGFSAFEPVSYHWSFEPDDVVFVNGTDEYSPLPEVMFSSRPPTEGSRYDITLEIGNGAGTFQRKFYNAVAVDNMLKPEVTPLLKWDSCLCNFDSLTLRATGARNYKWQLEAASSDYFIARQPSYDQLTVMPGEIPDAPVDLKLLLEASHGSCVAEKECSLPLEYQVYDSLKYAIELLGGENPRLENPIQGRIYNALQKYSNKCTGTEFMEPAPPTTASCTQNGSWCAEDGSGKGKLQHTAWFYYEPVNSGRYRIDCYGFDSQIAVYESRSEYSLKSGLYELTGANDDISDQNYNSQIRSLSFVKGRRYYIQVDGSAGGAKGQFKIYIERQDDLPAGFEDDLTPIAIFPQPAEGELFIEYEGDEHSIAERIEIYTLSGKMMKGKNIPKGSVSPLMLNIRELPAGIYVMKLFDAGEVSVYRIVIQ